MTSWRTWSCRRSRRLWIVCTQWSMAKTVASSKKETWAHWCMSWKVWFVTLLFWKSNIPFSAYQPAHRWHELFSFSLFFCFVLSRNSLKRGEILLKCWLYEVLVFRILIWEFRISSDREVWSLKERNVIYCTKTRHCQITEQAQKASMAAQVY